MRYLNLALLAALAACHGPLDVVNDAATGPTPDWTRLPEVAERVTTTADIAIRAWGGTPPDLDGWTVHLVPHSISQPENQLGGTVGLTQHALLGGGTITIDVWTGMSCPEVTVLAHEVGHTLIGDPNHTDRRWGDAAFWDSMAAALAATQPGEVNCSARLALGASGVWH